MYISVPTFLKNLELSSMVEDLHSLQPNNSTPRYMSRETLQQDTCKRLFTPALFTIAKTWDYHKYPSTEN